MKAIETRYKGYRFRSRLEARWAVFLDAYGLDWSYEPEGYELPSGRYLPDFRLGHDGWWLEIKGERPTERECRFAYELAQVHQAEVQIVWGSVPGEGARTFAYGRPEKPDDDLSPWFRGDDDRCQRALMAARSARFEHGESGPA